MNTAVLGCAAAEAAADTLALVAEPLPVPPIVDPAVCTDWIWSVVAEPPFLSVGESGVT